MPRAFLISDTEEGRDALYAAFELSKELPSKK